MPQWCGARREGGWFEHHGDHRRADGERGHYDVVQHLRDGNRGELVEFYRHRRPRHDTELRRGAALVTGSLHDRMESRMKGVKSIWLAACVLVLPAMPALCQERPAPLSGLQRGYLTAVGGAAFGAENTPMLAVEYGDTLHRNVQAYATFAYF